jgi:hypothetical protein
VPFWRRIAQSLDTNASGQAAFHGCFDKIWSEEGERDGHINLSNAAFLASGYRLLRRWLAATRTGQSQPAPEFDEPRRRLQACNFSPLRLGNLASNPNSEMVTRGVL